MKGMESKSTKSKAQLAQERVLAELDAADGEVPQNPGYEWEGNGASDHSFADLFEISLAKEGVSVGDVVKGVVTDVHDDFVLVDINYKSEGMIPRSEFRTSSQEISVKKGSEVDVYIDRIENDSGMVVLSKDKADMLRAWNDIAQAAENETVIEGTIIDKVKGGLSVDIGVKAFLPGSQVDLRPVRNMDTYIGQTFKFKVIKFNKRRGNIVLSRRVLLEEERESLRSQTLDSIQEGAIVKGIVKNITDYGAFVDLGGMDGLLHITDMSWGRIKHPSEILKVGNEIDVKVLKLDDSKERVSLGIKQLQEDPWSNVVRDYPVGSKLKGKVISLTDYGAFVEIGEGIEGLVHVSEMSWTKRIKHPSQVVAVGGEVDIMVLEIRSDNRHIILGMKQMKPNPWLQVKETYPVGTIIEGEVKSLIEFGVFVGIEEGIDGLVHISDFSWTKRVNHPSEIFSKGEKIQAVVLDVDVSHERISLGVKQLQEDPWANIENKYGIGTQHEVKVVKTADFGVFVELEPDLEGLIHISELATQRVEKPEEVVKVDDVIKAEIITIDKDSRRIGLSAKLVALRDQQVDVKEHAKKVTATSRASLGDLFGQTLKSASQESSSTGGTNQESVTARVSEESATVGEASKESVAPGPAGEASEENFEKN